MPGSANPEHPELTKAIKSAAQRELAEAQEAVAKIKAEAAGLTVVSGGVVHHLTGDPSMVSNPADSGSSGSGGSHIFTGDQTHPVRPLRSVPPGTVSPSWNPDDNRTVVPDDRRKMLEGMIGDVRPRPDDICANRGHALNTETVTYRDGLIVGHCAHCGDRFEIPWWPGGTSATRAEAAVEAVIAGEDVIEELLKVADEVDADIEALEAAAEKLRIAKEVIAGRLTIDAGATG